MTQVLGVIVSYRNANLTVRAAQSLAGQSVPVRTVVWDNYSDDATRRVLVRDLPVVVKLEQCETNLLWTPAVNSAVDKYLQGEDFILMMNNDCVMPQKGVASLLDVFEHQPNAGLVGPLCTALGGPQEPLNARGQHRPFRVAFILGACMMVRRSVWDQVGGLAEDLPLGADDHDYCIRVKHEGYSIYVDPRVCAQHKGHASAGPEWDEWGGRCWGRFNAKWAGYFANEVEAAEAHWGGNYNPSFTKGTGWTEEKYRQEALQGVRL